MTKKGDLFDAFETDKELEKNGIWLEVFHPDSLESICRIKVRPADPDSNPDYARVSTEIIQEAQRSELNVEGGDFVNTLYSRAVVVAWEGVTDKEGNELKCTEENVALLLGQLPQLRKIIQRHARDWKYFRVNYEEEVSLKS